MWGCWDIGRTRANASLSLADDEFACSIENEDADSDFGIHFLSCTKYSVGVFWGEGSCTKCDSYREVGGIFSWLFRASRGNILCSTEFSVRSTVLSRVLESIIIYFKMCHTQAYSAAYADVFDVSFDGLFFEFHRFAEEKG